MSSNEIETSSEKPWIYIRTADNTHRYALGEIKKPNGRTLICIGVNCSTAEPNNLDNTLSRVQSRANDLHYDNWIMLNLYPQRATYPRDMDRIMSDEAVAENVKQIIALVSGGTFDVWAAWGNTIEKRCYLKTKCAPAVIEAINNSCSCTWYRVGETTKKGHPRHPLYLTQSTEMVEFDIEGYLKKLLK